MRNEYKFSSGNLKGRDHLEDLSIDGKILEWILWKHVDLCVWLRIGTNHRLLWSW